MTHDTVTNFAASLVEMAKATERVPELERVVDSLESELNTQAKAIDDLGRQLEQSRAYAASLEQAKHDLEVARDDAELRFLEASDRTDRALAFVRTVFGNAGQVIQSLEPPREAVAEAVAEPIPSTEPPTTTENSTSNSGNEGESAIPPTPALPSTTGGGTESDTRSIDSGVSVPSHPIYPTDGNIKVSDVTPLASGSTSTEVSGGHFPLNPTANTVGTEIPSMIADAPEAKTVGDGVSVSPDPLVSSPSAGSVGSASGTDTALPDAEPLVGPYSGKLYIYQPGWVSRADWLAGGGTDESYDYRRPWGQTGE
jgi:hypothetical protein